MGNYLNLGLIFSNFYRFIEFKEQADFIFGNRFCTLFEINIKLFSETHTLFSKFLKPFSARVTWAWVRATSTRIMAGITKFIISFIKISLLTGTVIFIIFYSFSIAITTTTVISSSNTCCTWVMAFLTELISIIKVRSTTSFTSWIIFACSTWDMAFLACLIFLIIEIPIFTNATIPFFLSFCSAVTTRANILSCNACFTWKVAGRAYFITIFKVSIYTHTILFIQYSICSRTATCTILTNWFTSFTSEVTKLTEFVSLTIIKISLCASTLRPIWFPMSLHIAIDTIIIGFETI